MSQFKPERPKAPQEVEAPSIRFLAEQDGIPERMLKQKLVEFFKRDQSVTIAYLARIAFGNQSQIGVALCLKTQFGPDRGIAEKVGWIFGLIFGAHEHLDIVFLRDSQ